MRKYIIFISALFLTNPLYTMDNNAASVDWHSKKCILRNLSTTEGWIIPGLEIFFREELQKSFTSWDGYFSGYLQGNMKQTSSSTRSALRRMLGYYIQQFGSVENVISGVAQQANVDPKLYIRQYKDFQANNTDCAPVMIPQIRVNAAKKQDPIDQTQKTGPAASQTAHAQAPTDPAVLTNQKPQVSLLRQIAFYAGFTAVVSAASIALYQWLYPRDTDEKEDNQKEEIATTNQESTLWYLQ